ncbi:hypothetical protein LUZ61_014398 [Rhynchospora tenuis]|uniref:Enoyl reductase (ER) domain-containing protein n=1 Tax=Rhynchospora tenuis TaxID=198213 RepID=A0AAD5WB95_9POAL|nr:hypothetical protein LUZ61_014398 [Rhynchospora tenuis]
MMQAVQYFSYGGGSAALKHLEVPVPRPKEDELLIKVEAASLNPIDWRIQEGILRPILPPKLLSVSSLPIPFVDCKFPFTPGVEVAGEVIEIGANIKTLKKGDKVVSLLNYHNGGGLAQYVVAQESLTAVRPIGSYATDYVALPVAGVTALQILKSIGAKFDGTGPKCNILITAASGGVGHYLVQLAHLAGLHVTATCGARNIDLVKSLGANEVLDYKTPEGQQLASPSGKPYDCVINCVANTEWSSTLEANLTSDGKVIEVTPTPVTMARTVLDSTYTLDKAQEAWDRCMSGHATGKIVVEM